MAFDEFFLKRIKFEQYFYFVKSVGLLILNRVIKLRLTNKTRMQLSNENISIYTCEFTAIVQRATVQIKFPCNYFLQWKASNGKVIVSSKNRYQANKSQIVFNETLSINVNILYDKVNKKYLKKQSLLLINLISKSRPDQIKLVGRVAIDLAEVLNSQSFRQVTTVQLEYCSVEASLSFMVQPVSVQETTINLSELDRSSFNEYMSFQAHLVPYQQLVQRNQGSSTQRDFDEVRSARGSDKGEIRSLGREKNRMSSSSLKKHIYIPANRSGLRNEASFSQQQSKAVRQSSIPHQLQNKKFFTNKQKEFAIEQQNNFSFQQNAQQNNKKLNVHIAPILGNDIKEPSPIKLNNTLKQQYVRQVKQAKPIMQKTIIQQKEVLQSQNLQKITKKPQNLLISIEATQPRDEQLAKRIKSQQQTIPQRQVTQKNIQQSLGTQKIYPSQINPNLAKQNPQIIHFDTSFSSSIKDQNAKRLQQELSRSNSENKRILGLTEALNQLETRYTKLTLETQDLRKSWKKEKEQYLNIIQKNQTQLIFKEKQIIQKEKEVHQKNKINQLLQNNCVQMQKKLNQSLAEITFLKSQLIDSQQRYTKISNEKQIMQNDLIKLQAQMKLLNDRTSQSKDQLNKSFAERLTLYQQKMIETQNKLQLSENEKITINQKVQQLKSHNTSLTLKIKELEKQNMMCKDRIQASANELLLVKEDNQRLRKILQDREKQIKQQKDRIWISKDEQVSYQLREKDRELEVMKQQALSKLDKVREEMQRQIELKVKNERELIIKVEELQNTVLSQHQQISHCQQKISQYEEKISQYEQKISQLTEELNLREEQLDRMSESYKLVEEKQRQKLAEHEQLLLSLNTQIQQHQRNEKNLSNQKESLNYTIHQQDMEILKLNEDLKVSHSQLQLLKTQATLYQSKLLQQHSHHQKLTQSLQLSFNHQIYQLQIQLQQQIEKYKELQNVNILLKDALQDWQNKHTQDKIASSKSIGVLNDILHEKQSTMSQMENILKSLETDKSHLQSSLYEKHSQYQQVLTHYNQKHQQLKILIQSKQSEFLTLYECVKKQRTQLKERQSKRQKLIIQLQSKLKLSLSEVIKLRQTVDTLKDSLEKAESQLIQVKTLNEKQIESLKNEHKQEVDEYEQRIRQLQNILTQKDNQHIDRQMVLIELQTVIQSLNSQMQLLKSQIQTIKKEIQRGIQAQRLQVSKVDALEEEKKSVICQKQDLGKTLQEQCQRYTQLENTLGQCKQLMDKQMQQSQQEKKSLTRRMCDIQQQLTQKQQTILIIEQNYNSKLEQMKAQHLKAFQQMQAYQLLAKQQLTAQIQSLQQQLITQNQTLQEKHLQIQSLLQQKQIIQSQLNQIKEERQTLAVNSLKEHIEILKQQLKNITQENISLRTQCKQIPSLQRTIKLKTIQNSSLKYKSSTSNNNNQPTEMMDEIIRLKDEEIQALRTENQKAKDLELQLYQVQTLNQGLYQDIEKYEQEKFDLIAQLTQRNIQITELQKEVNSLKDNQQQLKQKIQLLNDKLNHYEGLILDYKGTELSSTITQSEKNESRTSSKLIPSEPQTESDSNYKHQVEIFAKKIKLLQTEIHNLKTKEEQLTAENKENIKLVKDYQDRIEENQKKLQQKETQLNKKIHPNTTKLQPKSSKPTIQYRNPHQVASTFKEIQSLLKKRNQFHSLQNILIKLYHQNNSKTQQSQHNNQDLETTKIITFKKMITLLSNQFNNLKATIMKLQGKNYQEKAKLISLLRPIEDRINEAVNFSLQ